MNVDSFCILKSVNYVLDSEEIPKENISYHSTEDVELPIDDVQTNSSLVASQESGTVEMFFLLLHYIYRFL